MLFDKICRHNGITPPADRPGLPEPEREGLCFHRTFRPDFLAVAGPFTSVPEAQAAVDAWVEEYNTGRPHQALDEKVPVTPAERFAPVPGQQRDLISLWLPATLQGAPAAGPEPAQTQPASQCPRPARPPAQRSSTAGRSSPTGSSPRRGTCG